MIFRILSMRIVIFSPKVDLCEKNILLVILLFIAISSYISAEIDDKIQDIETFFKGI